MKQPVLKHSDVVFMYAATDEQYRAYGATFTGWGGANTKDAVRRHHRLGMRCTGSMWCLTAGPRRLYESPELRGAVAVDIEGEPVAVPWLACHVHEGQRTLFGCTNNPVFRKHVRDEVRRAMAGGADGLHVDDHLGVASPAWYFGGGLCDCCIAGFRKYLRRHATPAQLRSAGVADARRFDYRDLIRRYARTRRQYLKVQDRIPLMGHFRQFHAEGAVRNVRELGRLASKVAGHPTLLSGNACLPHAPHEQVLPSLTHIICEVMQDAPKGTRSIEQARHAYAIATEARRPMASTARGEDWTYVKRNACYDLVRFWIALAYADGQRFMVPHPTRQWCHDPKKGTHWYAAPMEEFVSVYRFIRTHADCFDGFEGVDVKGFRGPRDTVCTVRRKGRGVVVHVLNRDYNARAKAFRPRENVRLRLPGSLLSRAPERATLLSYDADSQEVPLRRSGGCLTLTLPRLRLWTLVEIAGD